MSDKETKPKYVKNFTAKMWTENEDIKWLELKNKKGQQKTMCVVCHSQKSTF